MDSLTTTVDFFGRQDAARRNTNLLIAYYVAAVALIVVAVHVVVALVLAGTGASASEPGVVQSVDLWSWELFLVVAGSALAIIVAGSLYKVAQLSQGGKAVAEMLGGHPISPDTSDLNERKVLNVVEEMAIASGTPVPPVYVLKGETGINAFAAGFRPQDAIVAVTEGCVRELTRDELQGVIAHEFSHVLNGDMRLNIRLMGILHGILVIALLGWWIVRSAMVGGSGSRRRGGGKGAGGIALLGVGLLIVGGIGVFFAKLIKSAASRQREFLADASAVQFTRNPEGIGGALKKIGGYAGGSQLQHARAESASHLFFGNGLKFNLVKAMATHPPLSERIRRIDPSFSGDWTPSAAPADGAGGETVSGFAGAERPVSAPDESGAYEMAPDDAVATVGAPKQEHIDHARSLLSLIPARLASAARQPYSARAVLYCLLFCKDSQARNHQLQRLAEHADPAVYAETTALIDEVADLAPMARLPLAEIAMGTLRNLSPAQYEAFSANVDHLIRADQQIDLFEYALNKMIQRNLAPLFGQPKPSAVKVRDIRNLETACVGLLSTLARWGAPRDADAVRAFESGVARLGLDDSPQLLSSEDCGLAVIDAALDRLEQASPGVKRTALQAASACIAVDGRVTVDEAEVIRAIADALDCPMPPLLGRRL